MLDLGDEAMHLKKPVAMEYNCHINQFLKNFFDSQNLLNKR